MEWFDSGVLCWPEGTSQVEPWLPDLCQWSPQEKPQGWRRTFVPYRPNRDNYGGQRSADHAIAPESPPPGDLVGRDGGGGGDVERAQPTPQGDGGEHVAALTDES